MPARSCASLGPDCDVVLLGSIASGKYVEVLLPIFGERLLFPPAFVGRGDMSRGGLMLRCAASGEELEYTPVAGAVRQGSVLRGSIRRRACDSAGANGGNGVTGCHGDAETQSPLSKGECVDGLSAVDCDRVKPWPHKHSRYP